MSKVAYFGSPFLLLALITSFSVAADGPVTQPAGEKRTTSSGLIIIETKPIKEPLTAAKDDMVWVNYTGRLQSNGHKFDSSFDHKDPQTGKPQPISFVLGSGAVIKGWEEGLVGMKVGDKRQLIIPPDLGWRPQAAPGGEIPPNSTVVFDVELVGIYRGQ